MFNRDRGNRAGQLWRALAQGALRPRGLRFNLHVAVGVTLSPSHCHVRFASAAWRGGPRAARTACGLEEPSPSPCCARFRPRSGAARPLVHSRRAGRGAWKRAPFAKPPSFPQPCILGQQFARRRKVERAQPARTPRAAFLAQFVPGVPARTLRPTPGILPFYRGPALAARHERAGELEPGSRRGGGG
jgi:hypothetical protein